MAYLRAFKILYSASAHLRYLIKNNFNEILFYPVFRIVLLFFIPFQEQRAMQYVALYYSNTLGECTGRLRTAIPGSIGLLLWHYDARRPGIFSAFLVYRH